MKFVVEIPDDEIKNRVLQAVADEITKTYSFEGRIFKKAYGEVIKEMIYKPEIKQDIINRTVKQAAAEIRKKALPIVTEQILGERLFGGENENPK